MLSAPSLLICPVPFVHELACLLHKTHRQIKITGVSFRGWVATCQVLCMSPALGGGDLGFGSNLAPRPDSPPCSPPPSALAPVYFGPSRSIHNFLKLFFGWQSLLSCGSYQVKLKSRVKNKTKQFLIFLWSTLLSKDRVSPSERANTIGKLEGMNIQLSSNSKALEASSNVNLFKFLKYRIPELRQ